MASLVRRSSTRALASALVLVVAMMMSLAAAQQDVVTVAGGLDDVLARAATFNPSSITLSPNGDILFTEQQAHRIRWIPRYTTSPTNVQTLVGTAQGNTFGKLNVLLNSPTGLVRDDSSITSLRTRYWFFNSNNPVGDQLRILDVDYANEPFVTVVPTPLNGFITAIAPDLAGNVFVALSDTSIFKVDPAGNSVQISDTGAFLTQLINSAAGLFAMDNINRVYQYQAVMPLTWSPLMLSFTPYELLTDGQSAYYLVSNGGTSYTVRSLPGGSVVTNLVLPANGVSGLYPVSSSVVLAGVGADTSSYGSLVSSTAARFTNIIGGVPPRSIPGALPGLLSRLASPGAIQVDPNTGKVLLGGVGSLDLFDPTTNTVSKVFGTYNNPPSTSVDGPLNVATVRQITGIAAHPNNLAYYFLDFNTFGPVATSLRVLRLNNQGDFSSGNVTTILNDAALSFSGSPASSSGLALDRPSKSLFFPDSFNNIVYRYYLETGVLSIIAGVPGFFGDLDGVGSQAQFANFGGISVSPVTGMVYVNSGTKVKQINPDTGYVKTFAGDGSIGQNNGIGTAASFLAPGGLSVSITGVIYVGDGTRIRAINETTAEVTTAAGSTVGELDDLALRAQLYKASFLAVDNFRGGNVVFFTDNNINSLRRLVANDVCLSTVCSDANHCTTDVCVSALQGCVYTPNTLACDDGIECTGNDVCSNGVCVGGAALPTGSVCFNGNLCIINQHCIGNATCTGDALVCNDENLCTTDTCDPARGCVFTQVNCDDSNPCTRDKCVSNIGCVHEPISGAACDLDNNPCTLDVCTAAGVCTFTGPNPCDDGNPCTVDSCAQSAGCLHIDPSPCIGQNFQRDASTCACECNIARANQGCPVPADSFQCLCLVPNTGPFLRLEVHFNSTFGDRGQFSTDAQRDLYLRNQMAYYTLVNEASLVIVLADNNGINGSRRLVLDVFGETTSNGQPLGVADILSRFAAASQCNFLPPACAPVSNSIFGSIEIFLLNPFQSAAPLAVVQPFQSLPPYVDNHIIHDVVEFPSQSEGHYQISIPIYSAHNESSRTMAAMIGVLMSILVSIAMSMM